MANCPENLEVQLPELVDGADLDDETARTRRRTTASAGDSVRTAKALLSQLDDVPSPAGAHGLFPGLHPHPHARKLLENRRKMVEGELVDWGTAELLAFATLVLHRYPGEDRRRHLQALPRSAQRAGCRARHLQPQALRVVLLQDLATGQPDR